MSKHTPGPWHVTNDPDRGDGRFIETDDGIAVAYLVEPTDLAALEADARLIAAAPELLEELRKTRHDISCHPSEGIHSERCQRVRALIARIED